MKTSIVMSVYNGHKYLIAQLDSIKNQSVNADEVIILDDGSKDSSFQLISNYIRENNLSNWKVEKNPENLGWKKSFFRGICKCSGDVIYTCDQDDIWMKDKIEIMNSVLSANPEIRLLVADYIAFHYNDIPKVTSEKSKKVVKEKLGKKWRYIQRPGCVFAFTRQLKDEFESCWREGYAHDLLLWQLAAVEDRLYHIDYDAIMFRRHDSNSTPPKPRSKEMRLKLAIQSAEELNHIKQWKVENGASQNVILKIDSVIEFENKRIKFLQAKHFKLKTAINLLMNSGRYLKRPAWGIDILSRFK